MTTEGRSNGRRVETGGGDGGGGVIKLWGDTDMAGYKPKVISLTKSPGHSFGFYLRVEQAVDGHLIRCLDMGGPAELAGMKDGDRLLRVNGTFVDGLPHSEDDGIELLQVVDMVRVSGVSVTFHILEEASYLHAKEKGLNLSGPQSTPVTNGGPKQALKPKLCYLVKPSSGYGFSIRSVKGDPGLFMTEVTQGGAADRAGVSVDDRLLEINGVNVEDSTHDQVVDILKLAGSSIVFLLADEETDRYYQNQREKIGARLATTRYLPHKPRVIDMTKGPDGYGFLLKEYNNIGKAVRQMLQTTGHVTVDIDRGGPAGGAGLQEMDRLVAVDGKEMDGCSHEEVMKNSNSPPSYREALKLPVPVKPVTPVQSRTEELKPKLCKMEKTPAGYGFHLNGIEGVSGHTIKEVLKSGAADRAGMEEDDVLVEVNGVNAEHSSHDEVVAMIRGSGSSLEMLVANKSVYDRLKARGVAVTRLLLGETSHAQVHSADTTEEEEERREEEEEGREARPETPAKPAAQRERIKEEDAGQGADQEDDVKPTVVEVELQLPQNLRHDGAILQRHAHTHQQHG
ncbi:Na(+)/H(+) exchange regulatory cofactor NHE-RF3 [Liparis tanakae]|uniref:Na(+)/H(+) exchange regulatory cofactor NHE-RF3 n=1 Tax=Liparis tanakae TaxID=230148 RepID=A0A4Z2H342_9TELE|nr:Na(+)/H(+) exchange regulatory cofactor NHE-RF3 [Liparis tanakae]